MLCLIQHLFGVFWFASLVQKVIQAMAGPGTRVAFYSIEKLNVGYFKCNNLFSSTSDF